MNLGFFGDGCITFLLIVLQIGFGNFLFELFLLTHQFSHQLQHGFAVGADQTLGLLNLVENLLKCFQDILFMGYVLWLVPSYSGLDTAS